MRVMKVVDDADVRGLMMFSQVITDGDQIGRLASPASMVVEAELQSQCTRLLDER